MLRRIGLLGVCLIGASLSTGVARAGLVTGLGQAQGYNVFVFGNNTQQGPDAQGAVAVGGNANFGSGYDPGSQVGTSGTSLVVGGNYSNTSRYIPGNVYVGGNATINNPSIGGSLYVNGNLTVNGDGSIGHITVGGTSTIGKPIDYPAPQVGMTPLPVDFAAAQSYLLSESAFLGGLTANGITDVTPWTAITLTGSRTDLNIFSLTGAQLSKAVSFDIYAAAGSTVLVNIDGTADAMKNFAFNLHGVDNSHVLYNFTDATSLYIGGISVQGTILAPKAAVNFAGGNIDGTLIGSSITGAGEAHRHLFQGAIPNPPIVSVPEPSSVILLGSGLACGSLFALRQRRRLRNA